MVQAAQDFASKVGDLCRPPPVGPSLLFSSIVTTSNVTNTVVETSFGRTCNIPANTFIAGTLIRVTAFGTVGNWSGGGNLDIRIRINGTDMTAPGSGNFITGIAGNWSMIATYTVTSVGGGGAATLILNGFGVFNFETGASPVLIGSNTGPGALFADPTINNSIDVTARWSVASSNNQVNLKTLFVEVLIPTVVV